MLPINNPDKTEEEKNLNYDILKRHENVISRGRNNLGLITSIRHTINMDNVEPSKVSLRRMSLVIREIIRQYVNDVLENGVIEESESPWSAPVVLEDGVSVWILELWMSLRKAVIHSLGQMIFENRSVEHGILVFLI